MPGPPAGRLRWIGCLRPAGAVVTSPSRAVRPYAANARRLGRVAVAGSAKESTSGAPDSTAANYSSPTPNERFLNVQVGRRWLSRSRQTRAWMRRDRQPPLRRREGRRVVSRSLFGGPGPQQDRPAVMKQTQWQTENCTHRRDLASNFDQQGIRAAATRQEPCLTKTQPLHGHSRRVP